MRRGLVVGIVAAGVWLVACDGDLGEGTTTSGAAGPVGAGGMGRGGSTGGEMSQGGNGVGGEAAGGSASGGAGGAVGFPWEGALDPNGGPSSERLADHENGTTTIGQGFYDYVPPGYPGAVKWPLLVALHGVGENGNGTTELNKVLNAGIAKLIANDGWPVVRPFVVVMPQHTPGGACPGAAAIEAMIDYGMQNYEIDPRYVYLTGLSCGAIGSWGYLATHLDSQIAAMVPVAGNGSNAWDTVGCDLAKVAIWAFHGTADMTVYPVGTNYPMDNLAACPSPPALETKKTLYPDVGHNSWDRTYDLSAGHDIYTWMLGFQKSP